MKKMLLIGLAFCVLGAAGCGAGPKPDSLSARRSNLPSFASASPLPTQWERAADPSTPSPEPSQPAGAAAVTAPSDSPQPEAADSGNIFEIKEKMFIAQCDDINLNPGDYKGKTIKLEGIYDEYTDADTNTTYRYIIRKGPGCCGNDGVYGFEIFYDGKLPKANDWVEALGAVEVLNDDGYEYVALRLSKLTVLENRGLEFVTN